MMKKDEEKIYFEIFDIFLDMYDFYSYEHVCAKCFSQIFETF